MCSCPYACVCVCEWVGKWVNECMKWWVSDWVNEWVVGDWVSEWVYGLVDELVSVGMSEWLFICNERSRRCINTISRVLRDMPLKSHFCLKLTSLFAAWLFWTFHTKSHNRKALVILSHSWITISPTYLFIWNKWTVQPSGVFSWEKTPLRLPMQISWPWPPVSSFSHNLITVRQKKMWT